MVIEIKITNNHNMDSNINSKINIIQDINHHHHHLLLYYSKCFLPPRSNSRVGSTSLYQHPQLLRTFNPNQMNTPPIPPRLTFL